MMIKNKEKLRSYLLSKDYSNYNKLLKDEICKILIQKAKEVDNDFEYSTLPELVEFADENIEDSGIFKSFYMLLKEEDRPEILAEKLMIIYEGL